jgi:hypothetical protein
VHSIGELADLARLQLAKLQQVNPGAGTQAYPGNPQSGWAAEPQAGPLPGYAQQPQAGPVGGGWGGRNWSTRGSDFDDNPLTDGIEGAIADVALGAAAKFIGRAISRRVQRTVNERVIPTLAAKQEPMLREQIAIAERYPEIRACMTDQVVFLDGGTRVLPIPSLNTLTMQQADVLVAQLRTS